MMEYGVYVSRLAPKKDNFVSGHRACIGCGEALAVRLAFKAVGQNAIVVNATGGVGGSGAGGSISTGGSGGIGGEGFYLYQQL